jgi:hypothetical protein
MSQPVCMTCGKSGEGVEFPLTPKTANKFGEICAVCDESSPWLASPLVCVDCDEELTTDTAWGNPKYGEPRCEGCHDDHEEWCAN